MGLQAPGFSGFSNTSKDCWVNQYIGKEVLITVALSGIAGMPTLSGTLLRIDKFEYRYYLVLDQGEKISNTNIDHVLTIEEK